LEGKNTIRKGGIAAGEKRTREKERLHIIPPLTAF